MVNKRQFPVKLLLRAMPEDTYRMLIACQAKDTLRLNRKVSLEQTIYKAVSNYFLSLKNRANEDSTIQIEKHRAAPHAQRHNVEPTSPNDNEDEGNFQQTEED